MGEARRRRLAGIYLPQPRPLTTPSGRQGNDIEVGWTGQACGASCRAGPVTARMCDLAICAA